MQKKIILVGGAGLVGQNLVERLISTKAYLPEDIVVLDKHRTNLQQLQFRQNKLIARYCDLFDNSQIEMVQEYFRHAAAVVMLQAQIGGNHYTDFERNNVISTQNVLNFIKIFKITRLVHISSSVVESVADDFYTNSKKAQEKMVTEFAQNYDGICHILRPTLMFGWFDRKHLGWLSRFLQKVPVFPIPGNGRYMRQPLYVGDFCAIIAACLKDTKNTIPARIYNISGLEKIDYIDMIRAIKATINAKALILKIPYSLFWLLLYIWGIFDKNPPFTTQQLSALVAHDEFEVIDWQTIFGVKATPFNLALRETFTHPAHSKVALDF